MKPTVLKWIRPEKKHWEIIKMSILYLLKGAQETFRWPDEGGREGRRKGEERKEEGREEGSRKRARE